MIFEDIDTRPLVTVFVAWGYDDICPACGFEIEGGDDACYIDNEVCHWICVADDNRRR